MKTTKDVIVRLLSNLGSRKEVEQYLKQYASVDSQKFAILRVAGEVLERDLDALASSLTFLNHVGLRPLVVHGREGGARLEPADARKRLQRDNLRLVEALEELGTRARPIPTGVFESIEDVVEGRLTVHLDSIESSLRGGHLPIIACLGETPAGRIVEIDPGDATRALAHTLQPFKVIFLLQSPGLLDEDGRVISAVSLEEDHDRLLAAPWLSSAARGLLEEAKRLLLGLPHTSSVSITSPDRVARELFTHTGSGTLVRRGERVLAHDALGTVDTARLRDLLEACFRRSLTDDYFEKKSFHRIYLAESYRATAIITSAPPGVPSPYLDKFAVTAEAQGAGVGGSLWARMRRETPKLHWRARNGNEINPWYFQQAEGTHRDAQWTVFWYGLSGFDEIAACVQHALALPATLREHGTTEGG